jgi:FKBP12-rapamycin complex-associated protein
MRQYLPELMPVVVDALLDGGAVSKREVAVSTLGQIIQSTGYILLCSLLFALLDYVFHIPT